MLASTHRIERGGPPTTGQVTELTQMTSNHPQISIVVPLYNESEGIEDFHRRHLLPELAKLSETFEVIYVDDGSQDSTLDTITGFSKYDERIRVTSLSRNFGKEIATTAGIHAARGNATIVMDGDGQHPPSDIHKFIDLWHQGAQVVVGVRTANQREGVIKR